MDDDPADEQFAQYSHRWLTTRRVQGRRLAPKTVELYSILLDVHILPTFGTSTLQSIRTETVREWLARFDSPMTAAKSYRLLRGILSTAVEDERIAANPCRIKGAGIEHSPERPIIGPDVVLASADAIGPPLRCFVLLAGFGGLRHGELRALRRRHVDLESRTIAVVEQVVSLRGGRDVVTDPKSRAGRRTVTLPDLVVMELSEHLRRRADPNDDALLFPDEDGGFLRPKSIYRQWDAACGACGQVGLHVHDLRHAAGTLAAWTGATKRELMARLGHSSPQIRACYQHASVDRDRLIAAGIDALIAAATRPVTDREK